MKYPDTCHKVTFPIINVSKTSDNTRNNILKYLGISEAVFRTGKYIIGTRKYKIVFPSTDPIFDNFRIVMEKCIDSIVYKARIFSASSSNGDVNDLCLKVSIYISTDDSIIGNITKSIAEMSDCRYVEKMYTPFVTNRRYKSFGNNWAGNVTRRHVKKQPPKKIVANPEPTMSLSQILSQRVMKDSRDDLLDQSMMDTANRDDYVYSDSDEETDII